MELPHNALSPRQHPLGVPRGVQPRSEEPGAPRFLIPSLVDRIACLGLARELQLRPHLPLPVGLMSPQVPLAFSKCAQRIEDPLEKQPSSPDIPMGLPGERKTLQQNHMGKGLASALLTD